MAEGAAAGPDKRIDGGAMAAGRTGKGMAKETRERFPPRSNGAPRNARSGRRRWRPGGGDAPIYGALDLGTNNCRLLMATPLANGRFRVVDAFSRIIRLGEGISRNRRLTESAMDRAVEALAVCREKLEGRKVAGSRLIATEACRAAENSDEFLDRVKSETGLRLEIVDRSTEARLAAAGCASLVHPRADGVIVFDIGGGSSELIWLDFRRKPRRRRFSVAEHIRAWTSLPIGVVSLSETHGGVHVTPAVFEAMVAEVRQSLQNFPEGEALRRLLRQGRVHLLGTSGTVTTLSGVYLGLQRYDRRRVDGMWMSSRDVDAMISLLLGMSYDERVASPCIGADRADLVLAGCAILEAVRREWPCKRLRVADRGLREGILTELMVADGAWSASGRRCRGGGPAPRKARVDG